MQYLSLLFIVFTIIVVYKNPKNQTSWFIGLVILGWFLSPYGFILYLDRDNIYSLFINRYFNLPYSWWNQIDLMNLERINLIRLMNFGILLFVYAFASFSIAFTRNDDRKNIRLYLLLIIAPLFELFIYDPLAYKKIYLILTTGNPSILTATQFNTLSKFIYDLTRFANILYLLGALTLLIIYLKKQTQIPFIRNFTAFVLVGFIPIIVLFLLTFWWAPNELMTVSAIANYVSFNVVDLSQKYWLFFIFRYFLIIAVPLILYASWKYSSSEVNYRKQENLITKSINVAHLGARVFSHALKNQIISIQGEAEYLQSKLQGQGDLLESIRTIQGACDETLQRLNELYDRFRIIDLELRPAELVIPVNEALQGLARTIPTNIQLQYEYPPENPAVYLDSKHLKEAIVVILNNALEAIGGKEGHITVVIRNIDNWSIIEISDTGAGISKEQQKHIFEPFYTTKSSSKNWGIGLSYVHKIVTAHNGKIFVDSQPGQGSTFKLIFPSIRS